MQNLNAIPVAGKFLDVANKANTNFLAIKTAIEQLELSVTRSRGFFSSASALTSRYPSPAVGDWAVVQDAAVSPAVTNIWSCATAGTWSSTGTEWPGGNIDLTEYAKMADEIKAQIDGGLFDVVEDGKEIGTLKTYHGVKGDGSITGASQYRTVYIDNLDGSIYKVRVYTGIDLAVTNGLVAIGFYANGILTVADGCLMTTEGPDKWYEADVPEDCTKICCCMRRTDSNNQAYYDDIFKIEVFELKEIVGLSERIANMEYRQDQQEQSAKALVEVPPFKECFYPNNNLTSSYARIFSPVHCLYLMEVKAGMRFVWDGANDLGVEVYVHKWIGDLVNGVHSHVGWKSAPSNITVSDDGWIGLVFRNKNRHRGLEMFSMRLPPQIYRDMMDDRCEKAYGFTKDNGLVKRYTYMGEPVHFENTFAIEKAELVVGNSQGMSIYGDYRVIFDNEKSLIYMDNLLTGQLWKMDLPLLSEYHQNLAEFSDNFYEAGDLLPLLYLSNGIYQEVEVCHVIRFTYDAEGDNFSPELVQTITFPPLTYNSNHIVGGGFIWCFGNKVPNYYLSDFRFVKYRLPALDEGAEVTLTENDAIKSWEMSNNTVLQGGMYRDGKLYLPMSGKDSYIIVVDTEREKVVSTIPFYKAKSLEMEDLATYHGWLVAYCSNAYCYYLKFDNGIVANDVDAR